MSNHKFIQVEPPKEELTLPASISDFTALSDAKGNTIFSVKMTSTVATFTGIGVGDYVELTVTDKNTLIERSLAVLKIQTITSVNDVESEFLDSTLTINSKILENLSDFITEYSTPKIYKLPTNSFSLQVKTDSIVRYYEDPVDKTIMYLDLTESGSVCSITGNTNVDTYGEFQDYGGGSTLALTSSYTDWTSGAVGLNSNITMTTSPNKFTIVTPGTYKLEGSFSISTSSANRDITLAISKNGAVLPETENERHFQSSGSGGSISIVDLIEVAVGDEITVSVKANSATTMTINNISLNIKLLSNTGGTSACSDVWGHDRASLGIVTLNNTDKLPCHNIVPYLNSIFLGADDEN